MDYRTSFALAQEVGALEPELVSRLQASVGLRNVLTHEYVDIDLAITADCSIYDAMIDRAGRGNPTPWSPRMQDREPHRR